MHYGRCTYGRLTVPILETTVKASPFHQVFLIRHQSTQRPDSICTIRDTDNVILSDPSSLRYYTETRILAAASVIATRLRNALILIGVALTNTTLRCKDKIPRQARHQAGAALIAGLTPRQPPWRLNAPKLTRHPHRKQKSHKMQLWATYLLSTLQCSSEKLQSK